MSLLFRKADGNNNLESLNNRLVSYIDKVRLLQQASDVWQGGPPQDNEDRLG